MSVAPRFVPCGDDHVIKRCLLQRDIDAVPSRWPDSATPLRGRHVEVSVQEQLELLASIAELTFKEGRRPLPSSWSSSERAPVPRSGRLLRLFEAGARIGERARSCLESNSTRRRNRSSVSAWRRTSNGSTDAGRA
jgi:hypothetical protein